MRAQTGAMVYRFRDNVAMHTICTGDDETPSSPTIYLTPDLAREIGEALIRAAEDVKSGVAYSASSLGPVRIGDHE